MTSIMVPYLRQMLRRSSMGLFVIDHHGEQVLVVDEEEGLTGVDTEVEDSGEGVIEVVVGGISNICIRHRNNSNMWAILITLEEAVNISDNKGIRTIGMRLLRTNKGTRSIIVRTTVCQLRIVDRTSRHTLSTSNLFRCQ